MSKKAGLSGRRTSGAFLIIIFLLQIPSHIYHMVFEVMKNAMQATVDKYLETTDILPPIKANILFSTWDGTK
jgi:hypothetical protein